MIVKAIDHGWPNARMTPEGVIIYARSLGDLPYEPTVRFIEDAVKSVEYRPSVSRIRHGVFGRLGLLPPSAGSALAAAEVWAEYVDQRQFMNGSSYYVDEPEGVHPLVREALVSLDTSHGSWRAQFKKAYAALAGAEVARIKTQDLSKLSLGEGH